MRAKFGEMVAVVVGFSCGLEKSSEVKFSADFVITAASKEEDSGRGAVEVEWALVEGAGRFGLHVAVELVESEAKVSA